MGHKVQAYRITAVKEDVELPDACPHCNAAFELGSTNVKALRFAPIEETLRLIETTTNGTTFDALDYRHVAYTPQSPTLTIRYYCVRCSRAVTPNLMDLTT